MALIGRQVDHQNKTENENILSRHCVCVINTCKAAGKRNCDKGGEKKKLLEQHLIPQ